MQNLSNHGVFMMHSVSGTGWGSMAKFKSNRGRIEMQYASDQVDPVTAALRQMHDDIASEPIPPDFLELLEKIDRKMSARKDRS
jgi:Anti-sigma factor NepR